MPRADPESACTACRAAASDTECSERCCCSTDATCTPARAWQVSVFAWVAIAVYVTMAVDLTAFHVSLWRLRAKDRNR